MLNTNRELAGDEAVSRSEYVKWAASNIAAVWVGDIEPPVCERKYDAQRGDIFEVTLRGKVMKKEQASIDFRSRVLRNGTQARHYDTKYQSDDDLYLSFHTPVAGYLSVYITDGDSAYCLLPYMNSEYTVVPVQRDSTYVFFSTDRKYVHPKEAHLVDELVLYCEGDNVAIHELYVVFSPNKYSRPTLQKGRELEGGMTSPRSLSKKRFWKWLERSMTEDKDMSYETELLIVSPRYDE